VATVVIVVGACGDDGSTEPAPPPAEAEDTTVPEDGPGRDVLLEALVTIADVPEGYAELDAESDLGAPSLAAILDGSSCWSADIETESEAVSRFFLDDGIHGRLVESGMALLPTDDGARVTDALATTAPCIEQSSDGVWQTKVASDTAPDAGIPVDAVLQFTVTKEQLGVEEPFTERFRILRSGDVVGWVSAREDEFQAVADVASARFGDLAGVTEVPLATTGEAPTEAGGAADTSRAVSFDEIRDLCSYVSVEEIASIVQVEVRAGVPDEDAFDGVRFRGCRWDIGPEFEPGDNSDVTVNINDRAFADDPLAGPASSTIAGRPARQPAGYEAYLDMDGWTMGLSVYAGHNVAGQADPTVSSQALQEFATLLLDRIDGT
jgi:hypothetical protein